MDTPNREPQECSWNLRTLGRFFLLCSACFLVVPCFLGEKSLNGKKMEAAINAKERHMGSSQNWGPILAPLNIRCRNIN